MGERLKALAKYLRSFGKRHWTVEDYPLQFHQFDPEWAAKTQPRTPPWSVRIINWPGISGSGDTRKEALEDLRQALATFWSEHGYLPRPGSHVPLEWASTDEVERYDAIAREFFPRVLGIDYDSCIITDESSLADFQSTDSPADYVALIKEHYRIDVSVFPDGNLMSIFREIDASRGAPARPDVET